MILEGIFWREEFRGRARVVVSEVAQGAVSVTDLGQTFLLWEVQFARPGKKY